MILSPQEIEAESFRIIREEFSRRGYRFPADILPLIMRVVHATGDFDLAQDLVFHPRAVEAGVAALLSGARLVTDVRMVAAGINRSLTERFGNEIVCHLGDQDVIQKARESGLTRTYLAICKGLMADGEKVLVIGNAPTALLAVLEHLEKGQPPPALIVGVPVGFVGAAEYKERLLAYEVPYITLRGPRGGSPVAVALVNALLRLAYQRCVCHVT